MFKKYYVLLKPGIVYGNAITFVAGFFYASKGVVDYPLLLISLLGISLVIASGCVFNNYFDRDIDALMERTKNRALPQGAIKGEYALLYGFILGLIGFSLVSFFTNVEALFAVALGFIVYVVIYTMWLKRTSVHSTIIGSISGAAPIAAGYLTVTGHFDLTVVTLFLIMALWQMPHFFAIAIYRLDDYRNAGIPILSVSKGIRRTKFQILLYLVLLIGATLTLPYVSDSGYFYTLAMLFLECVWLMVVLRGFSKHTDDKKWARRVFGFSILVLVVFSLLLMFR